ncbi:uncharacterized protein LOC119996386 isoform X3 [Tripterygium wilfordii]|uniref:uncharacterized protein LOC119996386 isoform X3 n=1 Tax=Tripterygium wilfordii TaxID=458696 RepID=UPI0018F85AFF|nr:uncharacterized protein LOC119996386 isoform X3 [Tripterygium wilfordii]
MPVLDNYQNLSASFPLTSRFIKNEEREYGMVHVVSWMETLALRLLAVLANSTLSNSRDVASEQVPVQYGGLQFNMLDLTGKENHLAWELRMVGWDVTMWLRS